MVTSPVAKPMTGARNTTVKLIGEVLVGSSPARSARFTVTVGATVSTMNVLAE